MKKIYLTFIFLIIALCFTLFYMSMNKPIKIALIGNFEQERYSFVTNSMIAARIAETDINKTSGVMGRDIEIVAKNFDFSNPVEIINYLKKEKIEAVITSAQSGDLLKLEPYLTKNKIICISIGASSEKLTGKDDYIYRIYPDDKSEVETLIAYLDERKINKKFSIIYDETNMEYENSVKQELLKAGGKVVYEEGWRGSSINYIPQNPEDINDSGITLVLSSPRDTAFIVQNLKRYGVKSNLFGFSWAADYNLLYYGGKAVEGFIFISPLDFSINDKGSLYIKLTESLEKRNKDNGLIPCGVYEAINILRQAYTVKLTNHITLREALKIKDNFEGINGELKFNESGEPIKKEYIFTVNKGHFTRVGGTHDENKKD